MDYDIHHGSVVVWGDITKGGDIQGKDLTDIVQIACGKYSCAGLKSSGVVVAWGDSSKGGCTQGKDVTNVVKIACTWMACVVLKHDDTVVA